MRYNERYENSKSIQSIAKFYTSTDQTIPPVNDKDLFLRFYEELNYMIDKGFLDGATVYKIFAFYFLVAWQDDVFFWDKNMHEGFKDAESAKKSCLWSNAREFYCKMERYRTHEINNQINIIINNKKV